MPIRDQTSHTSVSYGMAMMPSVPVMTRQFTQWKLGSYKYISALNHTKPKPILGKGFAAHAVTISEHLSSGSMPFELDTVIQSGPSKYRVVMNGDVASFLSETLPYWANLTAGETGLRTGSADASISKTYAKLTAPQFDVGVTLGELRETIEGLANPLKALRDYIKQMKKLNDQTLRAWQANRHALIQRQRGAYTLSMLGNTWLEWRVGIRPLIMSIENLIEHLRNQTDLLLGKTYRVKASVKDSESTQTSLTRSLGYFAQISGQATVEKKWQTTTAIYFTQDAPLLLSEIYGYDAGSAPAVLWELTRLSFVVDRFIRVGEFLQSLRLTAHGKRTILGTVTSQKLTVELRTVVNDVYVLAVRPTHYGTGASYTSSYSSLVRVLNRAKPVLPAFNGSSLKLQQHLDHLALIWQSLPSHNWYKQRNIADRADRELRKIPRFR